MNTKADKLLAAAQRYVDAMKAGRGSIKTEHPKYKELEASISQTMGLLSEVVELHCGPTSPCPEGYECVDGRCKIIGLMT